jgi:polyphenol oxidase
MLHRSIVLDRAVRLSSIPGLVHGFTDRHGGVSTGRYASLDLGAKWGDELAAVEENRRRVAAAAGFDVARLVLAKQVHGVAVARARDVASTTEADAIACTRDEGVVVGVLTADCVPVLLADRAGRAAAAIHSGWRGTVAGVVPRTVAVLADLGIASRDLVAAIGPCIERAAFEVGPEVAARFDDAHVDRSGARPHVDLVAAVRDQLVASGVPPTNVERVGGCTHAHPDRWFSFRRDGAGIGQMLAFVGFA